jgi:hypothetical protein
MMGKRALQSTAVIAAKAASGTPRLIISITDVPGILDRSAKPDDDG